MKKITLVKATKDKIEEVAAAGLPCLSLLMPHILVYYHRFTKRHWFILSPLPIGRWQTIAVTWIRTSLSISGSPLLLKH